MKTLAERLAEVRAEKCLTQVGLAKAAGLKNQSIIGNLESGHRKNSSHIPAIAAALKVSALWLADGIGPRSVPGVQDSARLVYETTADIDARAQLLAQRASCIAHLWLTLPADKRDAYEAELRAEAGETDDDANTIPLTGKQKTRNSGSGTR